MKSSYLINFAGPANDFRDVPPATGDPRLPLSNLSTLCQKMDSLQQFLSDSINGNTLLGKDQMYMVSSEITSAIHQIMANGTVLLASSQNLRQGSIQVDRNALRQSDLRDPVSSTATDLTGSRLVKQVDLTVRMSYPVNENSTDVECFPANQADFTLMKSSLSNDKVKDEGDLKEEVMKVEIDDGECDVVEIDAVELLAEHVHFCDICGKGFKRDANLRMHMRAHGNQFKTPEALAKPDCVESSRKTRFSCPALGCNRNKSHNKFQPLKSVICVKNHFKRSHCPKLYSCNRCNKKSFSVVSDLKSHIKHCGESKWRCSCGTTFSRKDKLFGHMALFEGHMPEEDEKEKSKGAVDMQQDEEKRMVDTQLESLDSGFFDGLLDGLGGFDNDCFKDVFGSPTFDARMREFYEMA